MAMELRSIIDPLTFPPDLLPGDILTFVPSWNMYPFGHSTLVMNHVKPQLAGKIR